MLGLAFKGGTDDIRESPAIAIVKALLREGCAIRAYDPAAIERAKEALRSESIAYCANPYQAAEGADALLVLTDWREFCDLDLERIRASLAYPIVVDGRNLYDPRTMAGLGFRYYSVGRPDVEPVAAFPAVTT